MNLNPGGDVVNGQGAAGVWLNNKLLVSPPAGKPAWLTDSLVIFQTASNQIGISNRFGAYDIADPDGATWIAAAAGAWAAFLADGRSGVRTSWRLSLPNAALLGMVPGVLFVKTSYQTGGIDVYAVNETDPGKPLWHWAGAQPVIRNDVPQFSALDQDRVLWADGAGLLHTRGLPAPAQVAAAFDPFLVEAGGVVYLGYHTTESRFVLHRLTDASKGCVVATGPTFGTCGQAVGADGIDCLWSTNAAESGPVASRIVRLSEANEPLTQPVTPPPIIVVPPPLPPAPTEPVMSLNLRDCTLINTNREILDFPEVAHITRYTLADEPGNGQYFEYDKQDVWPESADHGEGESQCTLGVCLKIGGTWYASAGMRFWRGSNRDSHSRPGSPARDLFTTWFYDAGRWGPMFNYRPSYGEQIGFFVVQGNMRNNLVDVRVRERSGIVLLPFRPGETFYFDGTMPAPVPVPVPTPTPTPTPVPQPPAANPTVTYGEFLDGSGQLRARWRQTHDGHDPEAAQEAHLHWRWLVERYTLAQLLDQIQP